MTLIEMLRANGSWESDAAVTRIEKLEAENAELQSKVSIVRLAAKYAAKTRDDRIEKLEAALKPFLQLPIGVEAKDPAEMEVYQCHGWPRDESAVVTVADFRRARKALEGKDD